MRQKIIAGNWKMNKTIQEAADFIRGLVPHAAKSSSKVWLAVPFTAIAAAAQAAAGSAVIIGAQNMNDASEGAFTGEIAATMLVEAGAKFVILGHSERRRLFGESDQLINRKILRGLQEGLRPLLCIGETLEQREKEETEQVLTQQLEESLAGVSSEQMQTLVIAYEPVWAIGTGKVASSEQAEQAHQFCRQLIEKNWGETIASEISLLYGGSVRPENAEQLISLPNIDGFLVGGSSLLLENFLPMVDDKEGKINAVVPSDGQGAAN